MTGRLLSRILVLLIAGLASTTFAASEVPIGEFHQVTSEITRGARPSAEGLQALARLGVKTILNFENVPAQVDWETKEAARLGMQVISIPMSSWSPKTPQIDQALQIMSDSRYYPLFVHCQHGQDRTGLVTGLFRVLNQNWDPAVAYQEMLDDGFHQALFMLDRYYTKRTGYQQPTDHQPNY